MITNRTAFRCLVGCLVLSSVSLSLRAPAQPLPDTGSATPIRQGTGADPADLPRVTAQWDFENGDLEATIGARLEFRGEVAGQTEFREVEVGGVPARVMRFPAATQAEGFIATHGAAPNGDGNLVNEYTVIMDLMFPAASSGKWRALLQTDPANSGDAEFYVGLNDGIGAIAQYDGRLESERWHRVVFVVNCPLERVEKFIDGVLVNAQTIDEGRDGRWALAPTALLFTEDDGQKSAGFVNSIQFRDGLLSSAQVAALGPAAPEGVPIPESLIPDDLSLVISEQTRSITVDQLRPAEFVVTAILLSDERRIGGVPITYQWQKDGNDLPGATNRSFKILAVNPEHAGSYQCVIRAGGVSVVSDPAELALSGNIWEGKTVWSDGFEGRFVDEDWISDFGVWEFGEPASGPGGAVEGEKVAATVLGGDVSAGLESRLVRLGSFIVPNPSENPRLRFRHWYSFAGSSSGKVQIRPEGGEWADLATYSSHTTGLWAFPSLDLSHYAGQRVQIGFLFHSGAGGAPGWYIDSVEVHTGPMLIPPLESFESNDVWDHWVADNGIWEVGVPTVGPEEVFSGNNVAGTILDGNYAEWLQSRLISPALVVPQAQNPRLRFRQWYNLSSSDWGKVQIRPEGGEWTDLATFTSHTTGLWAFPSLDLSEFAGQQVQIGFLFHSEATYNSPVSRYDTHVGPGWYIDEIEVFEGPMVFTNPTGFESEDIWDHWIADNGIWEVGEPTVGPEGVFSGNNVVTILDGNYAEWLQSRLISPALVVPQTQNPRLRFRQWYNLSTSDWGKVQIRPEGGEWTDLATFTSHTTGLWAFPSLDLSEFAGQQVQIGFLFHSEATYNSPVSRYDTHVGPGWYIDEVSIESFIINTDEREFMIKEQSLVYFTARSSITGLEFGLGPDAPEGAHIDPDSGNFTWIPDEDQGPGEYEFKITVTDPKSNLVPLSFHRVFVSVVETNLPPSIDPITRPLVAHPNEPFEMIITAFDSDIPENTLIFSLTAHPDTDAAIDQDTGEFTWTPNQEHLNQTFEFEVSVVDDGDPAMSDSVTLAIQVTEGSAQEILIQSVNHSGGALFNLTANASQPGTYWIEWTPDVIDVSWLKLESTIKSVNSPLTVEFEIQRDEPQAFFRVGFAPSTD